MTSQAVGRAHLRDLPRCPCGRSATKELRNGVNAKLGVYCDRCGTEALRRFKAEAR